MIVFNLLTSSASHARAVANLILTERLATDVFVDGTSSNYCLSATSTVNSEPLYRVLFLTKALLYRRIEAVVQKSFPGNNFRLYATPVTHVNEAEAERVRQL